MELVKLGSGLNGLCWPSESESGRVKQFMSIRGSLMAEVDIEWLSVLFMWKLSKMADEDFMGVELWLELLPP